MPIQFQEAGVHDVSKSNPRDIVYIKGNETTDGSIRFRFITRVPPDPQEPDAHIELRNAGVWNDTGMIFSSMSINLGRDLSVSAVGEFLQTFLASSDPLLQTKSLYGHIPYHPFSGTEPNPSLNPPATGFPIMPVLDFPQLFEVFPNTGPFGDITGTTITIVFPTLPARVLTQAQHFVGSIGATAEIEITYAQNGVILNRFMIPKEKMDTPLELIELDFPEGFGLDGSGIVQTFTSVNTISLRLNVSGDKITRHDAFPQSTQDIILEEFVISDDPDLVVPEPSIVFADDASFVTNNRFP